MGVPWQCMRLFCLCYSQNFWAFVVAVAVGFGSLVVDRRFASPLKMLEAICNWIECTHAHATLFFGSFKWDIWVLMKMFFNSMKWSMWRCCNDHQIEILNKFSTICGFLFYSNINLIWLNRIVKCEKHLHGRVLVNLQALKQNATDISRWFFMNKHSLRLSHFILMVFHACIYREWMYECWLFSGPFSLSYINATLCAIHRVRFQCTMFNEFYFSPIQSKAEGSKCYSACRVRALRSISKIKLLLFFFFSAISSSHPFVVLCSYFFRIHPDNNAFHSLNFTFIFLFLLGLYGANSRVCLEYNSVCLQSSFMPVRYIYSVFGISNYRI